jgi:hypothetical protein
MTTTLIPEHLDKIICDLLVAGAHVLPTLSPGPDRDRLTDAVCEGRRVRDYDQHIKARRAHQDRADAMSNDLDP